MKEPSSSSTTGELAVASSQRVTPVPKCSALIHSVKARTAGSSSGSSNLNPDHISDHFSIAVFAFY